MIEIHFLDENYFPQTSLFFTEEIARKYIELYNKRTWIKWVMIDKETGKVIDHYETKDV